MKTKEIEVDGKKLTIWKMNFGFRSDYQSDTTTTRVSNEGGKSSREISIDNGKMMLMTLLYGIYESQDLGIPAIKDIESGFKPEEKEARLRKIRAIDINTDEVFNEINKLNSEVDEQVLKK